VMPLLISRLLESYDWRKTFIILGILVMAVVIPLSFFLKRDPSQMGRAAGRHDQAGELQAAAPESGIKFRQALRTSQFWIISAVYIFFGVYVQSVMVHIVPYARATGIDAGRAAVILSFLGLGSITGRIVMGSLSDRIGVKYTLVICLSLLLFTFVWLQVTAGLWTLYLFAGIYGFGYGAMIAMLTLAPARLFGLVSLGTLVGVFTCIYTFGGGVGPVLTGYIYDVSGSYRAAFISFAALAAAGLALAGCLKQPGQKESK
jgi:predicted MFS family arabinose efflux permease